MRCWKDLLRDLRTAITKEQGLVDLAARLVELDGWIGRLRLRFGLISSLRIITRKVLHICDIKSED